MMFSVLAMNSASPAVLRFRTCSSAATSKMLESGVMDLQNSEVRKNFFFFTFCPTTCTALAINTF